MKPEDLAALVLLAAPLLGLGLAVAIAVVGRARATVGPVLAAERPGRRWRRGALLLLHLGAFALVLALGDLPPAPIALVLALGAAISLLLPGFGDAVLGEHGVQRGLHARRFEDIEEWRLTGDHLRFRLFGEWTSVPLAPEHHAAMRARLVAACPERESPFA